MNRDIIVSVSSVDRFNDQHMGNITGSIIGPVTKRSVMLMVDKWIEEKAKAGIKLSVDNVMIVNVWVSEA